MRPLSVSDIGSYAKQLRGSMLPDTEALPAPMQTLLSTTPVADSDTNLNIMILQSQNRILNSGSPMGQEPC